MQEYALAVWTYSGKRPVYQGTLSDGSKLVFRTADPQTMPLPHPVMFQLHAMCSRVLAAKAAAGYPHISPYYDNDEIDELEVDQEQDDDDGEAKSECGTADVEGWLDGKSPSVSISVSSGPARIWPMGPTPVHEVCLTPIWETSDPIASCGDQPGQLNVCDVDGDKIHVEDNEEPRATEAAEMMLRGRMDERWGKMIKKLGREPAGDRWWRQSEV